MEVSRLVCNILFSQGSRNVPQSSPVHLGEHISVMLSPSTLRVLDGFGVYERVRNKALQFHVLVFKDGRGQTTDEYYSSFEKLYSFSAIRRHECYDVRAVNHSPRDGPNAVELAFANGQVESASFVIGAVSIHSISYCAAVENRSDTMTKTIQTADEGDRVTRTTRQRESFCHFQSKN